MGIFDKLDGKIKSTQSKSKESSEIGSINKSIKENEKLIDDLKGDIGQYYWDLYAEGKLTPNADALAIFEEIESKLAENKELLSKIDDRKNLGEQERLRIEQETRDKEALKAKQAEERKRLAEEMKVKKEGEE